MARQNRRDVFDPDEVCVMHCINRAVRRAMLCGYDKLTGKSYEHRRGWLKKRLRFLASQYAIDILSYTIMENHLHVILRNRPDVVKTWTDEEVARRIWNLFPKRKDVDGRPADPQEHELAVLMASKTSMEKYRRRLSDISWLMRQLAEKIARLANAEDQCTGRFWEGRFKSQPLLDEAAILACSAYVDLNPVRAKLAETLEGSDYTSVQDRIESEQNVAKAKKQSKRVVKRRRRSVRKDNWLAPVYLDERSKPGPKVSRTPHRASDKGFLPITLQAYLKLVDWTGRQIAKGKRGRIPDHCRPILERLGLGRDVWCEVVAKFGRLFRRVAGTQKSLKKAGLKHRSNGGPQLLSAR